MIKVTQIRHRFICRVIYIKWHKCMIHNSLATLQISLATTTRCYLDKLKEYYL